MTKILKFVCLFGAAGIITYLMFVALIAAASVPEKFVAPNGHCVAVARWDLIPLKVDDCSEFHGKKFSVTSVHRSVTKEDLVEVLTE